MYRVKFLVIVGLLSSALAGCNSAFVNDDTSIKKEQEVDRLAVLNTKLGIGYFREGRTDLAYQRLGKALEIQPNYAGALTAMALLLDSLGKPDEAAAHYRRAVAAAPSDSDALNNYGSFLCRQGDAERAIAHFERAASNPLYNAPEAALTNAGLCLARNGQRERAEAFFRRALAKDPKMAPALISMSELSLRRGRELAGRGYLQRYLEVAQHTSQSLWLGVQIENELGDKNAVSSYAMLLKANYPDAPETKLLLESDIQ